MVHAEDGDPAPESLKPIGRAPHNELQLEPLGPIETVPSAGFSLELGRDLPLSLVQEALCARLDVPREALSLATGNGRELDLSLTVRENRLRYTWKVNLRFALAPGVRPGVVIARERREREELEERLRQEKEAHFERRSVKRAFAREDLVEFGAKKRREHSRLPNAHFVSRIGGLLAGAGSIRDRPAPQPARITDWLFVGGVEDARDQAKLKRLGVVAVVNMAPQACREEGFLGYHGEEAPVVLERDALDDANHPLLQLHLPAVEDFVEAFREKSGRVLVHCHAGINRSVAVSAAYLMRRHRMRLLDIVQLIVKRRGLILSNSVFIEQLVAMARREDLLV